MTDIPPYPLAWPEGMPRTAKPISGQFKTSLGKAIENVEDSLRRFATDSKSAVTKVQTTSNKAGLTSAQPTDRGVSVWFDWDGEQRCIAVDRYNQLEHNVQAIHHIIEARRTELRHGGMNVVRQTFKGFTALPAPDGGKPKRTWRMVLGFDAAATPTTHDIAVAFRERAKKVHPDKGGSAEQFAELEWAKRKALAEIGE